MNGSTSRRHPLLRFLLALFAAVQVGAPSVASVAEAIEDTEVSWVGVHIESDFCYWDRYGPEADCIFCSFLSNAPIPITLSAALPASFTLRTQAAAEALVATDRASLRIPRSRAPPAA